jgi:hypothetical protein
MLRKNAVVAVAATGNVTGESGNGEFKLAKKA